MRPGSRPGGRRRRGFVLIVTLWVMVILGVLLTHLGYQVRAEAQIERRALNQSQLRWAARGAVHLAAARVREHLDDDYHSPSDDWWSGEDLYRDLALGQAQVSLLRARQDGGYGLDDEESRLNINVARPEHLMGFAGVPSVLAEDIVLYRLRREEQEALQADDETGAEESEAEGQAGEPPSTTLVQGPIRSLRELLAVEGVTEALLFEGQDGQPPLAELLTTVSGGKVNVNTAPEALLNALGLNEAQLEAVLARRGEQPEPFTSLAELDTLFAAEPDSKRLRRLKKLLDVRSSTFRLLARARLPQQRDPYHVEATLAAGAEALVFIRWREY